MPLENIRKPLVSDVFKGYRNEILVENELVKVATLEEYPIHHSTANFLVTN